MKMSHFGTLILLTIATVLNYFVAINAQPLKPAPFVAAATSDNKVTDLSGQQFKDKDLWNKLLTAQISPNSRQVRENYAEGGDRVMVAPLRKRRNNKLYGADEQEQYENSKQKLTLKKKWHKMLDDLIDSERPVDTDDRLARNQQDVEAKKKFEARQRKNSLAANSNNKNGADDSFVIIMKTAPSESAAESSLTPTLSDKHSVGSQVSGLNSIGQWAEVNSPSGGSSSARQPMINMSGHARSILDDKFGILNQSKFSTNNHLGLSGVPKFGSDDEY